MDSACLRLILCVIAGCGPAVTSGDEDSSTSGAEESSSSEPSTSSTSTTVTTDPATTADPPGTSDSGESGSVDSSSSSSGGDEPFVSICGDDGQFAAAVSGTNQQEHEGRRIWLSAVGPSFDDPEGSPDPIVVLMQTAIASGGFEMECPLGLTENSAYPSIAVVIDADDDGVCSDGDVAFVHQLFAWIAEQRFSFDGASAYSLENDPPWLITETAWQPVEGLMGFNGDAFCDYYVP